MCTQVVGSAAGARPTSPRLSPRNSPAARPRDVTFANVHSASGLFQSETSSPRLGGHLGRGITPRENGKQESHFAIRQFGVRPDIDFTFKRSSGDFSPSQSMTCSNKGHGCRSTSSDLREAVQAWKLWGTGAPVESIVRRAVGSCSPRREANGNSCLERHQYRMECRRFGVSDIEGIFKLGVGECSPRHHLGAGILFAARENLKRSESSNMITIESQLANELIRKSKSQKALLDVPETPGSPRNPDSNRSRPAPRPTRREWDAKSHKFASPTSSSRARHAQDLASVRSNLQSRLLEEASQSTRSGPSTSASASQYSCRLAAESEISANSRTPPSTSAGTSQRSCRLAPSSSTHSLRSTRSVRSSGSSYAQSHRSYRLAGDVLSEARASKKGQTTPRASFGGPSNSLCKQMAPRTSVSGRSQKLAGNILAELRASESWRMPTICDRTSNNDDDGSTTDSLRDTFEEAGDAGGAADDLSDPRSFGGVGSSDPLSIGDTVCSDPFSGTDGAFLADDLSDHFSVGDRDAPIDK